MQKELFEKVKKQALEFYEKAHIVLTDKERESLEVADFGLGRVYETGLELITYLNTELCCAKEMVLLPNQCCPEHIHAPVEDGYQGKEETFRCRYGKVFLYLPGEKTQNPHVTPPAGDEEHYTVFREVELNPGEQFTIYPGTKHWFKAGTKGAVISEFSTRSYDEFDIFTDPNIVRMPKIEEN